MEISYGCTSYQCCFQYYYVLLVVVSLQRPYFFFRVLKAAPYGSLEICKKECIGHVQNRMGTRLREIVKKCVETVVKGGNLKKKKTLGGKCKLTGKLIDKLTVYYG